jgi:hypothetical protein
MAKVESVTLKLKPGTKKGWQHVNASNGQPYSFKYTGGHEDRGGLKTRIGDGEATINVSLDTGNRYGISDVTFQYDTNNQLSRTYTTDTAAITDVNTIVETADYCVVVQDANAGNATIVCDPMISNDPRGPRIVNH